MLPTVHPDSLEEFRRRLAPDSVRNDLGQKKEEMCIRDRYMALQQGLVQAQDNPITAVYASKFYEVQEYYMPITAFPMVNVIAINKSTYDSLPAEYQTILTQFAEAFLEQSYEQNTQIEQNAFAAIGDGITTLEFTDDIFNEMCIRDRGTIWFRSTVPTAGC